LPPESIAPSPEPPPPPEAFEPRVPEPPPEPGPGPSPVVSADQILGGEPESEVESPPPVRSLQSVPDQPEPQPDAPAGTGALDALNNATYDQLRALGMSVTQTGRLLAHRERVGSFSSIDELNEIPGFSQELVADVRHKLGDEP
jgi:DNA uptake protein ComE-like DNA-binding protein